MRRDCLTVTVLLAVLAVVSAGTAQTARAGSSSPAPVRVALHCRGSTRAHVKIAWPSASDRTANRSYHWSASIPPRVRRWAYLIVPAARSAGLEPFLVAAVIRAESSGGPLAWQLDSDAHGLMQVLHASFEPAVNIRLGTSMLAGDMRLFHRADLALAAYNAGPGAVEQYGGVPPFVETQSYVVMVQYWRDVFAGLSVTRARTAQFNAAEAAVEAYYKRVCGR